MSGQIQNNNEELKRLSKKIDELKSELPGGELISLLDELQTITLNQSKISNKQADIIKSQKKITKNINDLKDTLMNPDDGVIVRVNKNTRYRKMLEGHETDNEVILREHHNLVKWKKTVERFLWLVAASLVGILTKLIFFTN